MSPPSKMRYIAETFDVANLEQAKNVVLSSDPNDSEKFDRETDYLIGHIDEELDIDENTVIHDFGCGMGRVSKKLIKKYGCNVVGTDLSQSMLNFAALYTGNPYKFKNMREYINANSVDVALCILVLQHVENPAYEIKNVVGNIKTNGHLVLLNENKRMIPLQVDSQGYVDWVDDAFDVSSEIEKYMKKVKSTPYINNELNIVIYRKTRAEPETPLSRTLERCRHPRTPRKTKK